VTDLGREVDQLTERARVLHEALIANACCPDCGARPEVVARRPSGRLRVYCRKHLPSPYWVVLSL